MRNSFAASVRGYVRVEGGTAGVGVIPSNSPPTTTRRSFHDSPHRSDPDRAAAAVQELLGGKFGEMSTFMNYTFQSFNFRNKQGALPFYDIVANIAAEEFGHVELVAKTINTMLTGATPTTTPNGRGPGSPLEPMLGIGNPHHFLAGGQGALPQNSQGRPWNGD